VPVSWPDIILNDASAVVLEVNEGAFFNTFNDPDYGYFFKFVDGLIPVGKGANDETASAH
jgi:hypothetical protein